MCVAAALGCRQEEQHAAAAAGLALRQGHQLLADSLAPRRLVDDDRVHLRNLAVALERGCDVDRDQADDSSVALGDPDVVVVRGRESLQSVAGCLGRCRIAQLLEELGDPVRVLGARGSALHGGESKRRSNIEPCSARS